eukprot:CAMPEP_0180685372 /NCGR_PEP_ID=MMETSP1037_2-20121125/72357_1 /TAXON_ID=632150 /ORGANISM="Azadinium spinosum, Strain 3D9" /LENGTH=75 /DNA_ID=CAMNT_0022716031 /DNA_START=64 /DNA_END=288 /DNA_ORIENTATION=+
MTRVVATRAAIVSFLFTLLSPVVESLRNDIAEHNTELFGMVDCYAVCDKKKGGTLIMSCQHNQMDINCMAYFDCI